MYVSSCLAPCVREVNLDRKSGVKPRNRLDDLFVKFRQLLHPIGSLPVLILSFHWIGSAWMRNWDWLRANLLHFKQSQSKLINQSLSHPITSSLVVTGDRRSTRYGYTGSRSYRPAHRWLRLHGRSWLTGAEVMVQPPSGCLKPSPITALFTPRSMGNRLEKVPQTLPSLLHLGRLTAVSRDHSPCGRNKKEK